MTGNNRHDNRAVAPVVGIALLIAITVILAAVIGAVVLGIGVGPAEAPQTTLSFTPEGDDIYLKHDGGEPLPAGEVVVINASGDLVDEIDEPMTAGERENIGEINEEISVVWQDPNSETEMILATFVP